MALRVTEDQSIEDAQGRVLFYSADRFLRDVVEGNCCFNCGAAPGSVPFNDEHVVPDWVLRRFLLHDKRITLPGGSELAYGRYKVPCCQTCNSALGEVLEKPVAALFAAGYNAIIEHIKTEGPHLLFTWLNLLFLKTHLKDRTLLINRDQRVASPPIGDLYDWPELHHIHCVARNFHTGAALDAKAVGSIFLFPAKTGSPLGDFDYADYYPGRALMVRLGDIGVVCVLNDACAALNAAMETLQKFTGPLAPLQWREVLTHFSYANILLKNRPRFHTTIDRDNGALTISADVESQIELLDFVAPDFGHILYSVLSSALDIVPFPEPEQTRALIREGKWGVLFDGEGRFQEQG
jgi:hypothetical protein